MPKNRNFHKLAIHLNIKIELKAHEWVITVFDRHPELYNDFPFWEKRGGYKSEYPNKTKQYRVKDKEELTRWFSSKNHVSYGDINSYNLFKKVISPDVSLDIVKGILRSTVFSNEIIEIPNYSSRNKDILTRETIASGSFVLHINILHLLENTEYFNKRKHPILSTTIYQSKLIFRYRWESLIKQLENEKNYLNNFLINRS